MMPVCRITHVLVGVVHDPGAPGRGALEPRRPETGGGSLSACYQREGRTALAVLVLAEVGLVVQKAAAEADRCRAGPRTRSSSPGVGAGPLLSASPAVDRVVDGGGLGDAFGLRGWVGLLRSASGAPARRTSATRSPTDQSLASQWSPNSSDGPVLWWDRGCHRWRAHPFAGWATRPAELLGSSRCGTSSASARRSASSAAPAPGESAPSAGSAHPTR